MSKLKKITKAMANAWIEALLSKFLLITFTVAAAKEMRERVAGAFLTEGYTIDPEKIPCMTFNAFDMDLLSKFYEDLGYVDCPGVIDVNPTREAAKIKDLVTGDNKISGLNYSIPIEMNMGNFRAQGALVIALETFKTIRAKNIDVKEDGAFDELKDLLQEKGLYEKMSDESIKRLMELFDEYSEILKEECLITFADQEPMSLTLLDLHPDYLKSLGFEHVVVDEFQDSNDVNMEFVRRLADCMVDKGGTIKSIMVIGDDAQSIYAFREANVSNMTHFDEKIGRDVKHLYMSENYRSFSEIVDVANELIKLNVNRVEKPLVAHKGSGGKCEVKGFYDEDKEYEYIIEKCRDLITNPQATNGNKPYSPSDICIIGRNKKPLVKLSTALTKADLPWVMMAPVKIIENSRVHAAISLVDAFFNPDATQLYKEYLNALCDGKLSETYTDLELADAISDLQHQIMNFENLEPGFALTKFHELLEAIGNEDEIYLRWLDMLYDEEKSRVDRAKENDEYLTPLAAAIQFVKEFKRFGKDTEMKMEQKYEGIAITTAHSSKGLEWPVVINTISAYDNSRLHDGRNVEQVEEERRLLFVSMTRAEKELYVTGQYTAYSNEKSGDVYNQFLKNLYDIMDPSGESYVPQDPEKFIREQKRREERNAKAREKRAAARAALLEALDGDGFLPASGKKTSNKITCATDYTGKKKKGARQMTKEEVEQYNKLTKNAKQMTLDKILAQDD